MSRDTALRHPLLQGLGVEHGFGTRSSRAPEGTLFPIQVHGVGVMRVAGEGDPPREEADAIVCDVPARSIGIVTADCVPILACDESGAAVAAIHAGWRGLAAGVVEAGLAVLRDVAPKGALLFAVIGPHVGPCCYEVDTPVLDAMARHFGADLAKEASRTTRPGHARLDLARLAQAALDRSGVAPAHRARFEGLCSACDELRFHSFRRAGAAAGRMAHYIVTR